MAQSYSGMLKGLYEASIIRVLNKAYTAQRFNAPSFIDASKIEQGQRELIKDNGGAEIVDVDANVNIDGIGGYDNLKRHLCNKAYIFNNFEAARQRGVYRPKGILIAGAPGCGKSLMDKYVDEIDCFAIS